MKKNMIEGPRYEYTEMVLRDLLSKKFLTILNKNLVEVIEVNFGDRDKQICLSIDDLDMKNIINIKMRVSKR